MNRLTSPTHEQPATFCPAYTQQHEHKSLMGNEELILPLHKRCIVQYSSDRLTLFLYYGDKEISFDEPELFAFGEQLVKQSRFIAKTAQAWAADLDWSRVKELLEQLLQEGVLKFADTYPVQPSREGYLPSPLPPAQTTRMRTWLECEAVSRELTEHSFALEYLELVIPIFRVAHIFMDAEGRQIGEANVFPKALRLDVPTEWRVCPYAGSRYHVDKPMNVTALKSMGSHWPQMMRALLLIRAAYLRRYPMSNHGWTVGGLEALATLVLAVPTYQFMKPQDAVPNGQLHPVLSNMFRVTDGLRMVTHQMIFVPVGEPTLPLHTPMTSTEIYAYSERNHAFTSEYGVCAGPKVMIEDFLNVLVNGVPSKEASLVKLDEQVVAALTDLESAFDYGLYGLRVHAALFSLWPVMTRTYAHLWQIMENWTMEHTDTFLLFRNRLQTQMHILNTQTYYINETWRAEREQAYADIYAHCADGLGLPADEQTLTAQIAPKLREEHLPVLEKLRKILLDAFNLNQIELPSDVADLSTCLMNYFLQVQAILSVACQDQQHINHLLERSEPLQSFTASDVSIHNMLQGNTDKRLAYLNDELSIILKIRLEIDKDRIELVSQDN